MIHKGIVGPDAAGKRLDDGARLLFPQLSKTQLRRIIDWGGCAVAGKMVRVASRFLTEGDEVVIGVMEPAQYVERELTLAEILYEDAEYLVVTKEAGLNSQRTPYQLKGTLEHLVGQYLLQQGIDDPVRIVHRLDRGTSGVMIFPKSRRTAAHVSDLLQRGQVTKCYQALVRGIPPEEQWEVQAVMAKIGSARYGIATPGRDSQSSFRLLAAGNDAALVEAIPHTGRTHQLRVHLAHCGLPVIGDATYGGDSASRMMLHCRSMGFVAEDGRQVAAHAPHGTLFEDICQRYGVLL